MAVPLISIIFVDATLTMKRVYCERGAYRRDLTDFERSGLIQIVHFPYEGRNKKIRTRATPSKVTCDSTYITWDDATPIGQMTPSSKFVAILRIVGKANEFDARHLDSAYKSCCHCFLTPDRRDIASNAEDFEELLGFKVFHAITGWKEFVSYVQENNQSIMKNWDTHDL